MKVHGCQTVSGEAKQTETAELIQLLIIYVKPLNMLEAAVQ